MRLMSLPAPTAPVHQPTQPGAAARLAAAWPGLLILVLGVFYTWLHLPDLGRESLWTDELVSVGDATHDLVRMLKIQAGDIHPPLHALLLWILMRITNDASEATVRLPSLIAVGVGLTGLALAAWRRLGVGAALLFMALGMASPLIAGFAAQARPHPLTFGLVCLTSAAWLYVLQPGPLHRRALAAFGVTGLLASLAQHYGALVFGLEGAVAVAWLGLRARGGAGVIGWRGVGLAFATVALAMGPILVWLAVTRQWQHTSGTPPLTLAWGTEVASWALEPFATAFLGGIDATVVAIWTLVVTVVGALALTVVGLLRRRGGADSTQRSSETGRLAIGLAVLGLLSLAGTAAVGQSLVGSPTLHYRSILSLMPLLYLGLGVALTVPFGRLAPATGVVLAIVVGAVAVGTPQRSLYGTLDQWREAAAILRDQQEAGLPGDRIALVEQFVRDDWIVTLNNAYGVPAPTESLPAEIRDLHWIKVAADVQAIPTGGPLLLVAFHYYSFDVQASIVDATRARFGPCRDLSVRGITILRCGGTSPG